MSFRFEDVLKCPTCGSEYSHATRYRIYWRLEDRETGKAVEVTRAATTESQSLAGNPSPRRDGLVIEFDGECGHYFELKIYQHKGNTFIETSQ